MKVTVGCSTRILEVRVRRMGGGLYKFNKQEFQRLLVPVFFSRPSFLHV